MIGLLALLTCLICPLLEMIDSWDPPIQTGNDTEYTLVIVALCVGGAYLVARSILKSPHLGLVVRQVFACCVQTCFLYMPGPALLFADTGPPGLPLRI
jgi:hypothetical protein